MSKHHKITANKCFNCGKYGHHTKDIQAKKEDKDKNKGKKGEGSSGRNNETNVGEEHIVFLVDEEPHNFDTFNTCNFGGNDEHLIF